MPHKYEILVTPEVDANVPDGDGYYLHHSFLDGSTPSPDTISISMLMDGPFESGTEPHTKRVIENKTYRIRVSITDDSESQTLKTLLNPYLNGDIPITIDSTRFTVSSYSHESTTMEEIWTAASSTLQNHPTVTIDFNTPTCVVHPRSTVTEMFPHRRSIFPQLAAVWNQSLEQNTVSSGLKLALDPFDVGAQVFEKPKTNSYRTYSTLTDIREDADGNEIPFFRQGYTGTCSYSFRNADDHLVKSIVALSIFAEYSGIGTDTHHGCGCVNVTTGGR